MKKTIAILLTGLLLPLAVGAKTSDNSTLLWYDAPAVCITQLIPRALSWAKYRLPLRGAPTLIQKRHA